MAKLVLIEDEPDISMLVEATLKFGGHQIWSASHGHQGIDLVRQHHPDMVLLDIQMPDISGYQVLKQLKADAQVCHIPVMLFSAHDRPEDVQRGTEMGAYGFLFKPFDPQELLLQVNHALDTYTSDIEQQSNVRSS
jgi:DNA-binding response OmpR family regulator